MFTVSQLSTGVTYIINFVRYRTGQEGYMYCHLSYCLEKRRVQMKFEKWKHVSKTTRVQACFVLCSTGHCGHVPYEIYTVREVSRWTRAKRKFVQIATYQQEHCDMNFV